MSNLIVKRECDEPMARSKNLLPCDMDCKNCMACIETLDTGERRHCTRHKNSNFALDFKIATAGMEPEPWEKEPPRTQRQWTDIETKRLIYLREQGLSWKEIAARMHRTWASVYQQYQRATGGSDGKNNDRSYG